jgi:chromosome partitioning protein
MHVDPEPGVGSPAGFGGPTVPAAGRPDAGSPAAEDRAVGRGLAGRPPATDADAWKGPQPNPGAGGPETADRGQGRPRQPPGAVPRGGSEQTGAGPVEAGEDRGWPAGPAGGASDEPSLGDRWSPPASPDPGRSGAWATHDSPTGAAPPVGPAEAPPHAPPFEAWRRSGASAHDPDGFEREPEDRGGLDTGLGVAAGAGGGVDVAPAAGTGPGPVREPELDAEPAPWTEPVLPASWPPPGASAGEMHSMPAADEPEVPPAPDPRWPRLFSVGAEAGTSGLARGGDPQSHQHAAEHQTPPAGPASSGEGPSGPPPSYRHHPSGGGGVDPSAVVAAETPTPEDRAGPVTAPDGTAPPIPGDAGVASDTAGAGQHAGEALTPSPPGPAETEQMTSRPPTSPSGAPSRAHGNMAVAGPSNNPSVSGETEGGGGGVNRRPDDQPIEEDEAAIAVREAVSRAAAQAGVDVSRETSAETLVEPAATPPGAVVEALGDTPRVDSEAAARNARVTFRIHTDDADGHGRILAVANQKGGVGKSTTAVNVGAYLALAGARVLVVDLDPQGNASTGLGLDHREVEPSIYDVLTGETPPATAIRATTVANLHVLPSTIDLAGAEVELVSTMSREGRLGRALESIQHYYDTVLIDCPPSLGLLTVNALAAADELLIPIQCEYYALEGLGQLLRNIELVRANLNPELRIGGIVLTMYDGRTRLAEQVVQEVRKHFSDLVYQTVVPRSIRLSEAPGYGLPIALYDPLSRGGIAYRDLALELAKRSGLLAPNGEGAV